jgi:hypothetical protein
VLIGTRMGEGGAGDKGIIVQVSSRPCGHWGATTLLRSSLFLHYSTYRQLPSSHFYLSLRSALHPISFLVNIIGTVTMILVPWPAAVWISSFASICAALSRILPNPKPSLFSRPALEIPAPLSFTCNLRLGGSQRRLTLIIVGRAWRSALLIAS